MDPEKVLEKRIWKIEISLYIVILMTLIYSVTFSYYTIMRHYSFRSGTWDLGILVQPLANAIKGKPFIYNAELYYSPSGSFFGVHFSPVLFIMVPFFYLFPTVETVLVFQSIILGMGAIPIYLISKYQLNHRLSALILSLTYLMNPLLQGINWYDFHPQAFFPFFILTATHFLKKRKLILFLTFIFLTLMTLEQSVWFIFLYSLYILWEVREDIKESFYYKKINQSFLFPFITILMTFAYMKFSSYIKYIFNPNPPRELIAVDNFKILEINYIEEIPLKALTNIDLTIKAIKFDFPYKLLYFLLTFIPSCFISFLSPIALLPSLLWLFLSFLSNWPPHYQIGFQYTAFTLPFVSIANIEALRFLCGSAQKERKKICIKLCTVMLIVSMFLMIFASPLSFLHEPGDFRYFRDFGVSYPSILNYEIINILDSLPKNASILTTGTIFPHIATNPNAYVIPYMYNPSRRLFESFVIYLLSLKYDYIVYSYYWDKSEADFIYNNWIKNKEVYGLFIRCPGFEVYKAGYKNSPANIPLKLSYKELYKAESEIVNDPTSESGKILMLKPSSISGRYAWYGPYITLTPGEYVAKFRIKVDRLIEGKIMKLDVWSNILGRRIASCDIYGENFVKSSSWHIFTLEFKITDRIADVEFRGLETASEIGISLDYIEVIPK